MIGKARWHREDFEESWCSPSADEDFTTSRTPVHLPRVLVDAISDRAPSAPPTPECLATATRAYDDWQGAWTRTEPRRLTVPFRSTAALANERSQRLDAVGATALPMLHRRRRRIR